MHGNSFMPDGETQKYWLIALIIIGVTSLGPITKAQQRKIPKDPVRFVDSSTGKLVPEVLVIPRYSSFEGTSTMLGEGPQHGQYSDYLAKPFVYRANEPFKVERPKSRGLLLGPFAFIGKGQSIEGTFIFAAGYRPQWFVGLWSTGSQRELRLTPISSKDSLQLLDRQLGPLETGASDIKDNCGFWDLPAPCKLALRFNKTGRELIRSFLQQARVKSTNVSP